MTSQLIEFRSDKSAAARPVAATFLRSLEAHLLAKRLLAACWLALICLGPLTSLRADEPKPLTANTLARAENAQTSGSIESMAWLEGEWIGNGLGGEVEEVWAANRDGQMMGMFRFLRDGKIAFYELMTLSQTESGPELKVKHFGPDLVGWEEKSESVTFAWVGQSEGRFDFHGLSFRPSEDGQTLTIYLALKQADGTFREGSFELKRK